jgi:Mrp family chromosome partitioning ATPase
VATSHQGPAQEQLEALELGGRRGLDRADEEIRVILAVGLDDSVSTGAFVAQLALANAHAGQHTLAIDANPAAPSLHAVFDIEPAPDLINLLNGRSTAWESCREVSGEANLQVLPIDPSQTSDPDVIFGEDARAFFGTIETLDKELVAIVAGPDLDSGGLAMATLVDSVILVARERSSRLGRIRDALRHLERADVDVLGLVLDGGVRVV